jgi:hypothetical protein
MKKPADNEKFYETSLFTTLVLPCSLRSHRETNPTPKNGYRHYLALPAHHPERKSRSKIERMKSGILKYKAEKKKISAWNATAYNEAVSRKRGVSLMTQNR